MRTLVVITALAAVAALVGPGAGNASPDAASVTVHGSRYGQILFDGRGFALYAFTHDRRNRSTCSGACAKAWPPFLVDRAPAAAAGARRPLLGTTRRADGRLQVTYAGRPLYYYIGDTKPGQILCQNVVEFGGTWLVVSPGGKLVR
jgi:predicted lipoprotein with Yx(FWY)xxD motif